MRFWPRAKRRALCQYCLFGVTYTPGNEEDHARAWEALMEHDQVCPSNPIRIERDRFRETLRQIKSSKTLTCPCCSSANLKSNGTADGTRMVIDYTDPSEWHEVSQGPVESFTCLECKTDFYLDSRRKL